MLVFGIADKDESAKPVILEEQFFVDTKRGIFITQHLYAWLGFVDRASGNDIDAHDLEFCGGQSSGERWPAMIGDRGTQHFGLLHQGSNQAESLAAVLGA